MQTDVDMLVHLKKLTKEQGHSLEPYSGYRRSDLGKLVIVNALNSQLFLVRLDFFTPFSETPERARAHSRWLFTMTNDSKSQEALEDRSRIILEVLE